MSESNPVRRIASHIPQFELQWLGGVKTIAGRLTFYRGILTFAMLIPVAYESAIVQSVFPSVWAFALFLFAILAVAAVVEYAIIYPSQIRFNKTQMAKNDRDPIYERVKEIQQDVEDIKAASEEQERRR